MNADARKKWLWPLLLIALVSAAAFSGSFDTRAEAAVESALKRSLLAFGVARGLNSAISAAQGTEVSVTPMGMGVTLAPGEALDPLNDLVERFSGFMLVSSVALGTQRVLLEVSAWLPYSIFLVCFGLAVLALRAFAANRIGPWTQYLWRAFLVLAIVRFVMPIALIGSEWLYSSFLQARHMAAERGIAEASTQVSSINQERGSPVLDPEDEGSWERLKQWAAGAKTKAASAVQLSRYSEALKETANDTVELIVVFFLSTFVFPVAVVWALWRFLLSFFRWPPPGDTEMD